MPFVDVGMSAERDASSAASGSAGFANPARTRQIVENPA